MAIAFCLSGYESAGKQGTPSFETYVLDYNTPTNAALQGELEAIDARLRGSYGMTTEQVAVGLLDLQYLRLAMVHPDRIDYAASVAKVGILRAYFQLHPEAATRLDPQTRHELGLMAKASSNEMAAKFSRELGLRQIQEVLNSYHFYDTNHGGGIWVGRHYGGGGERIGDPLSDNSHAATVRQLLRYFLLLEQGRLVSPEASKTMREIFASPDIPHDNIKFVEGFGRPRRADHPQVGHVGELVSRLGGRERPGPALHPRGAHPPSERGRVSCRFGPGGGRSDGRERGAEIAGARNSRFMNSKPSQSHLKAC